MQILQFYRLLQMDPPPLRLLNPFPEIEDLSLQQLTIDILQEDWILKKNT